MDQLDALVRLLREALGNSVAGAYLFGSAVSGGLRPASDLDLFAVVEQPMSKMQCGLLIDGLRPISARARRPPAWRPVELTVVVEPDVKPWRYPPRMEFQSGEWMRDEFDSGADRPWPDINPDLSVLIAMVRHASRPLIGPPAARLLPDIPRSDIAAAMTDGIDALLADLNADTTNVLLTLARIWHTLAAGEFATKDAAAEWAMECAPDSRPVLETARASYLGITAGAWTTGDPAVLEAAREMVRAIRATS